MRLLSQTPLIQQNHRVLPHPFSTGFSPLHQTPASVACPATVHSCSQNETEFSATLPNRHLPTPPKMHPRRRPSAHHIGPLSTSHSISSQQTPASLPKGSTQSRHPRFLSLLFSFSLFSLLPVAPSALVEPTKREPYHQKCLFLKK